MSAKSIGNTIANGEYQGCITPSDMSVATDNTLSCTLTGIDTTNTHSAVIQDLFDDYSSRAQIYNIGETEVPGFTDNTDMFN